MSGKGGRTRQVVGCENWVLSISSSSGMRRSECAPPISWPGPAAAHAPRSVAGTTSKLQGPPSNAQTEACIPLELIPSSDCNT